MAGPRSPRLSPIEQRTLEQERLTERLSGISMSDFGPNRVRFYLTSDLAMPDSFDGYYHVCRKASDGSFRLSSQEAQELHLVDSLFVFCNYKDPTQLAFLEDITNELDLRGTEAPPLFLVLHTHASKEDSSDLNIHVRELLLAGIDGIISDDYSGQVLVWEARLIMAKTLRLSGYLSFILNKHRAEAKKASLLKECIDVILWGYLRARLAPTIPALDESLIDGSGKHLIHGFEIGVTLGEGMSGRVCKLFRNGKASGNVVKMQPKTTFKRISDLRLLKRTIAMSKMLSTSPLSHPNIVKLLEVLHSPSHILMLMEDAGPENLYHYLVQRPLGEERTREILTQSLRVVQHLHGNQICHRDLKPENFIASEMKDGFRLTLVDFDMAVEWKSGSLCSSACGTIPFAAPEVLLDQEYDGMQADIWSMGVVMCEVLLGVRSLEAKLCLSKVNPGEGEKPSQAVARVIRDYFRPPGTVLKFAGEGCRHEFRHFLPICAPILTGTLRTRADDRWDAAACYNRVMQL